MIRRPVLSRSVALVALILSTQASLAQSAVTDPLTASNEVFLGQTGDTNVLTVTQTGSGHLVGANSDGLRLNQLGDRNEVGILQVGAGNGVGRMSMIGQPGGLTGLIGTASGLFQRGDDNFLDIIQRSRRDAMGSQIGAIDQSARSQGSLIPSGAKANQATIRQIGGEYLPLVSDRGESTGEARHEIREISQVHIPTALNVAPNSIEAQQTGERQEAGQLRQSGAGNSLILRQSGLANGLRLSAQTGEDNRSTILLMGERNTLGNAEQDGLSNEIGLRLDGTGNFVDQAVQAGLGGLGGGRDNSITVSIVGNDNGGEGTGGYRALSAQETVAGAYASSLEQYGDGNALTLTIGSDALGRADGNYFSSAQRGFDNSAYSLMTGDGNEFALSQDGDGNQLEIVQTSTAIRATGDSERAGNIALLQQNGTANRADIKQSGAGNRVEMEVRGKRNQLAATQTGIGNRMDVKIVGNDNLRPLAPGALPAARSDPLAGTLTQDGMNLQVSFDLSGDSSVVSALQKGTGNVATGFIGGVGNWTAVRQSGEGHMIVSRQFGVSNSLFVQQQ